jgi:hypothetical protein
VTAGDVPVTWSQLLEVERARLAELLPPILDAPARAARIKPPTSASRVLGGPSIILASAAVVLGPASCAPYFKVLLPLLPRVIAELRAELEENTTAAKNVLSFANAARCCGASLPADAQALEPNWLPRLADQLDDLDELERQTLAFAALAAGRADLGMRYIGGGPLSTQVTPGETFGFDVQRFVRYLATAYVQNVSHADIELAWLDFVHQFPYKLAADTLSWPDLLWAARVVATHFEGIPVGEVAARLHRLVTGAAAA